MNTTNFPRHMFHRSTSTVFIIVLLCVILGGIVVVLNGHHSNTFGGSIGATSGKSCSSSGNTPVPVKYSTATDQSGLYATRNEGLYRFTVHNGHLEPVWFYSMGWCAVIPTPTPSRLPGVTLPTPNIITSATVANGIVCFGVLEDTGIYLYAINASDGSRVWCVKVGNGRGLLEPLVLHGLVYISTTDDNTGNHHVIALDTRNGAMRWSYDYPQNPNDRIGVGMSDVGANAVFILDGDRFFALNAINGKALWTTLTEGEQQTTSEQFFDGVLYVSSSSTCFNCEVQPATSAVYAYNPTTGAQLWRSQLVAGYPSPAYEVHGVVYYGTQAGDVYALQAKDGVNIWHSTVGGEVRTLPQLLGDTLYVGAGLFDTATNNPNVDPGHILALNATTGMRTWSHALSSTQYDGYEPIVAGANTIFIGTRPSFIYAFSGSQGTLVQHYAVPSQHPGYDLNNMPNLTYVS